MTNGGKFQYATTLSVSHVCHSVHHRLQIDFSHRILASHIHARDALESALEAEHVVFPQFEALDDIGLLIAGTEDQPLHHDVARSFTEWVSKVNYNAEEEAPVPGWEVGRREYNMAMVSPYAPSSVILGLGEETKVLLGVQRDQIERVKSSGKCTVVGGTGKEFYIVRETEHLVVIEAERGFMFTGDFKHAGVKNVSHMSPENALVELLIKQMSTILDDKSLSARAQSTGIVDMLCTFPELNKLCRFHCTTQLHDGKMKPPLNTMGFIGCLPNPPRCKGRRGCRGPDKKKRKTRSCQMCLHENCPGRTTRMHCVNNISIL
jgi:hypothetical protein